MAGYITGATWIFVNQPSSSNLRIAFKNSKFLKSSFFQLDPCTKPCESRSDHTNLGFWWQPHFNFFTLNQTTIKIFTLNKLQSSLQSFFEIKVINIARLRFNELFNQNSHSTRSHPTLYAFCMKLCLQRFFSHFFSFSNPSVS